MAGLMTSSLWSRVAQKRKDTNNSEDTGMGRNCKPTNDIVRGKPVKKDSASNPGSSVVEQCTQEDRDSKRKQNIIDQQQIQHDEFVRGAMNSLGSVPESFEFEYHPPKRLEYHPRKKRRLDKIGTPLSKYFIFTFRIAA